LWSWTGNPRRWAPARFLQAKGHKLFDFFLLDEMHEERSDESAQSMAAGKYMACSPKVIGLTGTPAEIERVKTLFGIYSKKVPEGSGGYSVDHSATVLLFDRAGKFVATIAPEEDDPVALAKLERIAG
jgi:cytochrome oxidase Cu insertion factor (SCO1/SenC/PrrC family)